MAIRITIEIQSFDTNLQSVALLNSGFESESAEILIPQAVAEEIGFLPVLPAGTSIKSYETVNGIVKMYSLKEPVNIKVIADIKTNFVDCKLEYHSTGRLL